MNRLIIAVVVYVAMVLPCNALEPLLLGVEFSLGPSFDESLTEDERHALVAAGQKQLVKGLAGLTERWHPKPDTESLIRMGFQLKQMANSGWFEAKIFHDTLEPFHKVAPVPLGVMSDVAALKQSVRLALSIFFSEHRESLRESLDELYADLSAIHGPPTRFAITMDQLGKENQGIYMDALIHVDFEDRIHSERVQGKFLPQGWRYETEIVMPNQGDEKRGHIYRAMAKSWIKSKQGTRFCIYRSRPGQLPNAILEIGCPSQGECRLQHQSHDRWFRVGCADAGVKPLRRGHILDLLQFTGTAWAQSNDQPVWHLPSLETLVQRLRDDQIAGTGFTVFRISTDQPLPINADRFAIRLAVNDVPIWPDGIPPARNTRPFNPQEGLAITFALESLNFTGHYHGCDAIEAELLFFRGDKETGDAYQLRRPYVALRHPVNYPVKTQDGIGFEWDGHYVPPPKEAEFGVFILGRNVPASAERGGGRADERKKRHEILAILQVAREKFDALDWTIPASLVPETSGLTDETVLPLVSVMRPPRIYNERWDAYGYGLLAGVQLPSGQVRFTFFKDERVLLTDHLRRLSAKESDPQKKRILKSLLPRHERPFDYPFKYTEKNREQAEDWICGKPRYLP